MTHFVIEPPDTNVLNFGYLWDGEVKKITLKMLLLKEPKLYTDFLNKLLFLSLISGVVYAKSVFHSPLQILAGHKVYRIDWNQEKIEVISGEKITAFTRQKCNQQLFLSTIELIETAMNRPSANRLHRPLISDTPQTPYDFEIQDSKNKKYYIAMGSRLGKFIRDFPDQLLMMKARAEKQCSKK